MNKRFWILGFIGLCLLVFAATNHRRPDERTITIHVPEMASAQDVRIVTNAALDEIWGGYDGMMHVYKVDLGRHVLVYEEQGLLLNAAFRDRLVACIKQVGYDAKFTRVAARPLPPGRDKHGRPFDNFPNRVVAIISIPGMKSNLDANRIVEAVSFARTGDDPKRIQVDAAARTLSVTVHGGRAAAKNVQHAIASSGFSADDVAARYGRDDAEVYNWHPLLPDDT